MNDDTIWIVRIGSSIRLELDDVVPFRTRAAARGYWRDMLIGYLAEDIADAEDRDMSDIEAELTLKSDEDLSALWEVSGMDLMSDYGSSRFCDAVP